MQVILSRSDLRKFHPLKDTSSLRSYTQAMVKERLTTVTRREAGLQQL
jgi:hypothetical protein